MLRAGGKTLGLVAVLALLLGLFYQPGPAQAHGKEVDISLHCVAPDPARPLVQACSAAAQYPDGDLVTDADLQLTAVREGKAEPPFGPVKFAPAGQPGSYTATMSLPAYGRWRMTLALSGAGSGQAELVQELLPPAPGTSPEIRARLQVVTAFGLTDVRNIGLRIAHLLGAVSWFALSALVLIMSRLPDAHQRGRVLRRLAGVFPWGVGASLLVLAVSGMLSARYNTPTRSPGLFDPGAFDRLPFGHAYLLAFLVKLTLGAAIVGVTLALIVALRRAYGPRSQADSRRTGRRLTLIALGRFIMPGVLPLHLGSFAVSAPPLGHERRASPGPTPDQNGRVTAQAESRARAARLVTWLAGANVVLGLLAFANVVVLAYLHILSHVGAAFQSS